MIKLKNSTTIANIVLILIALFFRTDLVFPKDVEPDQIILYNSAVDEYSKTNYERVLNIAAAIKLNLKDRKRDADLNLLKEISKLESKARNRINLDMAKEKIEKGSDSDAEILVDQVIAFYVNKNVTDEDEKSILSEANELKTEIIKRREENKKNEKVKRDEQIKYYEGQLKLAEKDFKGKKYLNAKSKVDPIISALSIRSREPIEEELYQNAKRLDYRIRYELIKNEVDKKNASFYSLLIEINNLMQDMKNLSPTTKEEIELFEKIKKLKIRIEKQINKQIEKTRIIKPIPWPPKVRHIKNSRFSLYADFALNSIKPSLLTEYTGYNGTNLADVDESFSVSLNSPLEDSSKYNYKINGGVGFVALLLKKSAGFMVSANFINASFNFNSDYYFSWKWLSGPQQGKTFYEGSHWDEIGNLNITPINFNIIFSTRSIYTDESPERKPALTFNFYGGVTLFITKIYLKSHIGVSEILDDYTVDWFPFEFEIKQNKSILGGNIGFDFEKPLGDFGIYLGCHFFFCPKQQYTWKLIDKTYSGHLGKLQVSDAGDWEELKNFKCSFKTSLFRVQMGIRFYLF